MFRKSRVAFVVTMLLAQIAGAEELYFNVPIRSLNFTEGALPNGTTSDLRKVHWQWLPAMYPYAVVDGDGEAYVEGARVEPWGQSSQVLQNAVVAIRVANG